MKDQKVLLIDDSVSANISNGAPRPTKKPPLVYKYNSAAGPFRKGFTEPGRNQACPCGSGKKFKHCHLGKMEASVRAGVVKASKNNQEAK